MITAKKVSYTGVMTALVFVGTFIITIPIPFGNGYIHLGDGFVFLAGIFLGPIYGALAAGLGSALADLQAGYAIWAFPTFLIKALMAFTIGYIMKENLSDKAKGLWVFLSSVVFAGYFLLVRGMLIKAVTPDNSQYLSDIGSVATMAELLDLTRFISVFLIILSVTVPLLLFGLFLAVIKSSENKRARSIILRIIGAGIGGLYMVLLYYLTEYILYGSPIIPIFAIPLNLLQFGIGILLSSLLMPLRKLIALN